MQPPPESPPPTTDATRSAPGFVGTVWLFAFRPNAAFSAPRGSWSQWNPLVFACVADTIGQFGAAATTGLLDEHGTATIARLALAFCAPVVTIVSLYVSGAIVHGVLRVLGVQRAALRDTVDCLAFASGPNLLLAIPLLGPVAAMIWSTVITVVGLARIHRTTKLRAFASVVGTPLLVIVLALGLRGFVMEAYKIPSRSMVPTLEPGDHILVDKTSKSPGYGETIVFAFPENRAQDFVKRVIGRSGDRVEVVGMRPVINGWPVPWCGVGTYAYEAEGGLAEDRHEGEVFVEFLGEHAYLIFVDATMSSAGAGACPTGEACGPGTMCLEERCGERQGPYSVPEGESFVLGDNRNNAFDSRGWFQGRGGSVPRQDVRGRVRWIWMSFAARGEIRWDRVGADAQGITPLLPPYQERLSQRIRQCVARRPSREASSPPAP